MGCPPREVRLELVGIPRVRHRVRGRARDPARAAQEEEAGAGRNLSALMLFIAPFGFASEKARWSRQHCLAIKVRPE